MAAKWGLTIVVASTVGALWGIDVFLARAERVEVIREARNDYEAGVQLMSGGRAADAVDRLRQAHALDRANLRYTLQLVSALVETGKLTEADTLLAELLTHKPNDSETNLAQARLLAREGKWSSAFAYYHRAIYGSWDSQRANQSVDVRLELARLLAQHGSQKDLLAEVLPLETEAGRDPEILKQVASLYMTAGSPVRAANVYRQLLRDGASVPAIYDGLGDAELALGNYRGAAASFQGAIQKGANRDLVRRKIDLAASVAELDPTLRRLTSREKFDRSVRVLGLALDAYRRCASAAVSDQTTEAENLLVAHVRGNPANELAEQRLSVAERLWQARIQSCGASTSADDEPAPRDRQDRPIGVSKAMVPECARPALPPDVFACRNVHHCQPCKIPA